MEQAAPHRRGEDSHSVVRLSGASPPIEPPGTSQHVHPLDLRIRTRVLEHARQKKVPGRVLGESLIIGGLERPDRVMRPEAEIERGRRPVGRQSIPANSTSSFTGNADGFTEPLRALAVSRQLPTLVDSRWTSWYEAAAALWPVIAEQKGSPLATSCHCAGTPTSPADEVLDFVADVLVREAPLDEAEMSIIEIRTLGGAAQTGPRIPTGNCEHAFFVDLVTLYDSSLKTPAERQVIVDLTNRWVDRARAVPGLGVDFSGTHSQSDDVDRSAVAAEIFGSSAMAQAVSEAMARVDPANRFRFHPFAKILT